MRILLICVTAAAVLAACSGRNDAVNEAAEGPVIEVRTEYVEVPVPAEELGYRFDTTAFLENFGVVMRNPPQYAEEMLRSERATFQVGYGRQELILWDVLYRVEERFRDRILGERPPRTFRVGEDSTQFENHSSARRSLREASRWVLSNPITVRLIGDRVVDHVGNAGVDQRLYLMLRTARPTLEREFTLLPGVDDAWLSGFRSASIDIEELEGTPYMREICGETLPRDCVDAQFFLIRRYRDGGLDNVAAWQGVGLEVLEVLENRPEFAGL